MSGHGHDDDALDRARREAPYRRLVLLSGRPDAPRLANLLAMEDLAGVRVDVHAVDPLDLAAALAVARRVLDAHARDRVRVHVAGGPNLVANALLLAAFERGVEAFWCHARGTSRLPVAVALRVEDRFTGAERAVLLALPPTGKASVERLAPEGLAAEATKATLLRLRRKGLVAADARDASLTTTGAYYRAHLAH